MEPVPVKLKQNGISVNRLPWLGFLTQHIFYDDIEHVGLNALNGSNKANIAFELKNGHTIQSLPFLKDKCHQVYENIVEIISPQLIEQDLPIDFDDIASACQSLLESKGQNFKKTADFLINQAICHNASDIYFHLAPTGLGVIYKIDGLLCDIVAFTPQIGEHLVNCIKVDAGMILYRRDTIQEGRITRNHKSAGQDFRISVMPSESGERLAIRLFDKLKSSSELKDLNFPDHILAELKQIAKLPSGFFIICGPSGSGKTTTLYALLRHLNAIRGNLTNIITLEDPVEHRISGITQIQIKSQGKLNFSQVLKSSLRQDPGVLMIGEIRDTETANAAIQAALTGHLVFSTLHCGSAAEAITRLLDLNVKPFLLDSTLKGVLCQRIIRKVCQNCATDMALDQNMTMAQVPNRIVSLPHVQLQGTGCKHCRKSGYATRTVLAEYLCNQGKIGSLIKNGAQTAQIQDTAVAQGMEPIYLAGIQKIIDRETNLEEIKRVLGL